MNKKEIVISKQRYEIVHENFFEQLKISKISFIKYAEDNNLDRTIISKWKNGSSNMTVEQIYQAAQYFKITVNDLYYTTKEKKNISVLADKTYDPILAQQSLKIDLINQSFKQPWFFIIPAIFMFSIITVITYFLINISFLWSFLTFLGLFFCKYHYNNNFAINKTYIINYLDEIYYKRENVKNKHYFIIIGLQAFALLAMFLSIGFFPLSDYINNSNEENLLIIYTIIIFIYFLVSVFSFLFMPFKFKREIYDNEITGYKSYITLMYISILQLSFCILIFCIMPKDFLVNLILSSIVLILNIIGFIMISKEYSEYRLFYEEYEKDPRELFPLKVE